MAVDQWKELRFKGTNYVQCSPLTVTTKALLSCMVPNLKTSQIICYLLTASPNSIPLAKLV